MYIHGTYVCKVFENYADISINLGNRLDKRPFVTEEELCSIHKEYGYLL